MYTDGQQAFLNLVNKLASGENWVTQEQYGAIMDTAIAIGIDRWKLENVFHGSRYWDGLHYSLEEEIPLGTLMK